MPQIPRIGPGKVIPLQRVAPQDLATGVGEAALGRAFEETAELSARIADAANTARADRQMAEANIAILDRVTEYEQDPDYETAEDRFSEERESILEAHREGLTREHQGRFDTQVGHAFERGRLRVRAHVQGRRVEQAGADLETTMQSEADLEGRAESPEEAARHRERAAEAIGRAIANGTVTAQQGQARLEQYVREVATGNLTEAIRENPGQALVELLNPESSLSEGLREHERQAAIGEAGRAYSAVLGERRRTAESLEKAAKEAEERHIDSVKDQGDALLRDDKLEELDALLRENWDDLSSADRRFYHDRIVAGGGFSDTPSNVEAYLGFQEDIAAGRNVRAEVDSAFREGDLNKSDRDSLVRDIDREVFGDAKKFLSDALRVGDAVRDPAARFRGATALRMFDDWVGANPKASREEAVEKARELADRSLIVKVNEMNLSEPMPKFAEGTRKDFDVQAAKIRTGEARDRGDISESEFAAEWELLERWDAVRGLAP